MTTETAVARTELARWFTGAGRADHIGHFTFKRDVRGPQRAIEAFSNYVQALGNVESLFGRRLSYLAFAEQHDSDDAGNHVIVSGAYHVHALLGNTERAQASRLSHEWGHGHSKVSPYDGDPAGGAYVVKTFGRTECGWDVQLPDDGSVADALEVV